MEGSLERTTTDGGDYIRLGHGNVSFNWTNGHVKQCTDMEPGIKVPSNPFLDGL